MSIRRQSRVLPRPRARRATVLRALQGGVSSRRRCTQDHQAHSARLSAYRRHPAHLAHLCSRARTTGLAHRSTSNSGLTLLAALRDSDLIRSEIATFSTSVEKPWRWRWFSLTKMWIRQSRWGSSATGEAGRASSWPRCEPLLIS